MQKFFNGSTELPYPDYEEDDGICPDCKEPYEFCVCEKSAT